MDKPQTEIDKTSQWLNSKDTMRLLKISSCHLMHMRQAGKIKHKKQGNSFWYLIEQK
ncbi:hypothetical protein H5125_02630 [Shewanella sp. SR44-4]|uniref:hypothetical protein n=1 Tax=Shewanella sp. SR44-4 TaxID=2760935 RepID=UPI0016034CC5|nr:hypothetical protein [Shewanella sp. SR44-4]MBB1361053.1 hypothetical protein [Shewanella sp. SR44-4]